MRSKLGRGVVLLALALSLGCGGGGGGSSPTEPTHFPLIVDALLTNTAGEATLQRSTLFVDDERIGSFSATNGTFEARMDTRELAKMPGPHNVRVVLDEQTTPVNRYRLHGTLTFRGQAMPLPETAGDLRDGDSLSVDFVLQ